MNFLKSLSEKFSIRISKPQNKVSHKCIMKKIIKLNTVKHCYNTPKVCKGYAPDRGTCHPFSGSSRNHIIGALENKKTINGIFYINQLQKLNEEIQTIYSLD